MGWTIHVALRWETRDAYRVLMVKLEEKKTTLKMCAQMGEDNIKIHLP